MNFLSVAEKYIRIVSNLWPWWINDEDRISMQFFADMCASMNALGYLSISDLYNLPESEVIEKFRTCDDYLSKTFKKFEKTKKCYKSNHKVDGKYCVNVKSKRRFVNPLVKEENIYGRVYDLSESAKKNIDDYMKIPNEGYNYLDFEFTPIKSENIKKLIKK